MIVVYQGRFGLLEKIVKPGTMILFKEKWIEFIEIDSSTPTTISYQLMRTIQ